MKNKILITLLILSALLNIVLLKKRIMIKKIYSKEQAKYADFYSDFENGSNEGWQGEVTKNKVPAGNTFSLKVPSVDNQYFSVGTGKTFYRQPLIIGAKTRVEFDYFLRDASNIYVQLYSPTRKDNFNITVSEPKIGEWARAILELGYFKDNAHTGASPQRGDEFANIAIYAGTADESAQLWIDNFRIVNAE